MSSRVKSILKDFKRSVFILDKKLLRLIRKDSSIECETSMICDVNLAYRSMDGTCNNLQRPSWGSSVRALGRLADPVLRLRAGRPLPSARLVSHRLVRVNTGDSETGDLSGHMMQWGQFLSHDLGHTPEVMTPHLHDCCQDDPVNNSICAPIIIAEDDPLYGAINKTCMNFVRSTLAEDKCSNDRDSDAAKDQINIVTSFIDGSMIYGSTLEQSNALRQFKDGKLNETPDKLMESALGGECTIDLDHCFRSGDRRTNEHPGLTLYHTHPLFGPSCPPLTHN